MDSAQVMVENLMTSVLENDQSKEIPISEVNCPLEYETVVHGITVVLIIEIDYRTSLFGSMVLRLCLTPIMESSLP